MTDAVRDPAPATEHRPALPAVDLPPSDLPSSDLPPFDLPSTGPDALPWDTALAAVLGYARGRRPLRFRSPDHPEGRWFQVLAFGFERFDRQWGTAGDPGDADVLVAEGLHGRLDPAGWAAVRGALDDVRPIAGAAVARAAGREFWALPDDEFCVLDEPGTVGAALREIWTRCAEADGVRPEHVSAALHRRQPALLPHVSPTTRRQLWPHLREGDSGVEAVVHRELRANAAGFAALETTVAELLGSPPGAPRAPAAELPLTRLRLHDVLLWLAGSLRFTHAVALGQGSSEWQTFRTTH
jgi:hypothetical protein